MGEIEKRWKEQKYINGTRKLLDNERRRLKQDNI